MAAYDFPDSPTNGQTVTVNGITYTYNSAKTRWDGAVAETYSDSSVNTHLNTSTASANEVLSWTGSDYNWSEGGVTTGKAIAMAMIFGG